MTIESKTIRGECPACEGTRNCEIKATHRESWSDEENGVSGDDTFRILKCLGCETAFVQQESWFSEDIDYRYNHSTGQQEPYIPSTFKYWPATTKRKKPTWRLKLYSRDIQLVGLLEEVYSAYDANLNVLAAIGVRTTFDRASELLGVDPAKTFQQKLEELAASGKIGDVEKGTLGTLTDAGSAAAHRGWRPKQDELDIMLDVIESFLNRNFILEGAVQTLKNAVPAKPKPKPTGKKPGPVKKK